MINFSVILILSILFPLILTGPVGWKHPRGASPLQGNIFLFLIFSVIMLAVSKWISAGDLAHRTLPWMASVCTGILLFLLLMVLNVPSQLLDERHETVETESAHDKPQAKTAFSITFWILLGLLVVLILI